jgi:pyruvate/2-oxoglutarate dehydrogenase complex dihydrolipoamide dehydrogenase (E3) component
MKYDYDLICIGLGPAGMPVSLMAAEMGLKVCAVEKNKLGGGCVNCGCIPSKALLKIAKLRHDCASLSKMRLEQVPPPQVKNPFDKLQTDINFIRDKKTLKMFGNVEMLLEQGPAAFADKHTIQVGEKKISAAKIFIATGSKPAILPIPGLKECCPLTNENIFTLSAMPESMAIIGGDAIACELAQAFSRLGCKITMFQRSQHLLSKCDYEAAILLEEQLRKEGVILLTGTSLKNVKAKNDGYVLTTDSGWRGEVNKILAATGRSMDFSELKLENAGIKYGPFGIATDKYLRTSVPWIYAVGDCNGQHQYSHSAMHQGMIALLNAMRSRPFKKDFRKYAVPYTIFTEPQISAVGMSAHELNDQQTPYETYIAHYDDYSAAIAEETKSGFIKVFSSARGRIYGVVIAGEGSGEMINEWTLAIQNNIRMKDILMTQHSFPTMGILSKRTAEAWMINRMQSHIRQKLNRLMFKLCF